jgi:hypothetical protein
MSARKFFEVIAPTVANGDAPTGVLSFSRVGTTSLHREPRVVSTRWLMIFSMTMFLHGEISLLHHIPVQASATANDVFSRSTKMGCSYLFRLATIALAVIPRLPLFVSASEAGDSKTTVTSAGWD